MKNRVHKINMNAPLDIASLSDPILLEKINKLRDLSIGQHVPLPQLVVVGDQSSGKSSLLQSLTGIPFPKSLTLCTRHATQITSRRDKAEHVEIRITAGPRASEIHKNYVETFNKKISSISELRNQFTEIMQEANEMMGLRSDISTGEGAVFSEDVLKIEMNGPDQDYLTMIDVPGIFRNTTDETSKNDIIMVKELVQRYIKDDRTIILAVLPSNVDIATQEILELAEEYDKDGERTLGVLTKPDLVHEASARTLVCDLVRGKRRPLALGYFLVRNNGADEDMLGQSELDKFFLSQPWSNLPEERLGILALRAQLGSLLADITRREFPKLFQDVKRQLREFKEELSSLGPPRQEEREQRSFLSHIAETFQVLVRAALNGNYNANPLFRGKEELRLITHVVNITEVFGADFRENGHSQILGNGSSEDVEIEESLAGRESEERSDSGSEAPVAVAMIDYLRALLQKAKVDRATEGERDELGDLLVTHQKISIPEDNCTAWINHIYFRSRALDLGTFNANIIAEAFAEQSHKWEQITRIYMSRIILMLHRFIGSALSSICPEQQTYNQLWSAILDSLVERYQGAMTEACKLIDIEKRMPPYTLNRRFSELFLKAQGERTAELLRPKARSDIKQYADPQFMVNLDDIPRTTKASAENMSNTEHLQELIHDILYAYYGLAVDRFIDNVFLFAVHHDLLHGSSSPLSVFTQEWVINLESDHLEQIVGESRSAKRRRAKCGKKIDDLSAGLSILRL